MSHWRLDLTPHGRECRLWKDGEKVEHARAVMVRASVDGLTSVVVEYVAEHIEIVGEDGETDE